MIATPAHFPRFFTGQSRLAEMFPRNRAPVTDGQRQLRDCLFERAGTIDDYFAQPRAPSLADELADSRREVDRLRQELIVAKYGNREECGLAPVLVQLIGKIVEMSQRLFPGPVSFEYSFDPENPSDEWLVFDVVAQGEYADYRDREFQWHEEVEQIVPGTLCEFRLCVMPQR